MATTTLSRWTPTFPAGVINMLNPFAGEGDDTADSGQGTPDPSGKKRVRPANGTAVLAADSSSSRRRSSSIMFAEPDSRNNSETGSRPGSIGGGASKRNTRPKTRFSLCHPPPTSTTRQRLHRRPRSILQLHLLSADARPRPAFDVIHAANFSVRLTRTVTKLFKARHSLCPNDLVVMHAEKYETEEDDDDEQDMRDVIGLICKGKKEDGGVAGKPKICLVSGMEWEASQLPNGGYEFHGMDDHGLGLTVRWVPKRNKEGSKSKDRRFNFSTISPNSRRHPVIASLTKTSLEIYDRYKMPDASTTTPLSTPRQRSTILAEAMDEDEAGGLEQLETDDLLRELITMTSIWVTFKEGWSPTFRYDDKDKDLNVPQRTNSISLSLASPVDSVPGSPSRDNRNSVKSVSSSIFRRGSILKAHRVSVSTVGLYEGGEPSPIESVSRSNSLRKPGRPRGDSTATVLVHRAASNRQQMKNLPLQQSSWQADFLPAATDPLPENVSTSSDPDTPSRKSSDPPPHDHEPESDSDPDHEEAPGRSATIPRDADASVSPPPKAEHDDLRAAKPDGLLRPPGKRVRKRRSAWRLLLCGASVRDE
nr:hypothetical protein CFP56_37240 [Quercus suber]